MGVDFSHCDASWSYGGFNRARERLAATIGIKLDQMVGFDGERPWPDPKAVPLVHLLDHSDCEGVLTAAQCRVVAPALRDAVARWPDDYDKKMFLELATGLELAAKKNQPLRFL